MDKELERNKDSYFKFLESIKEQINTAKIQAARTINKELISLYWHIGKNIVSSQHKYGWGTSVVERLSKDLRKEFPGQSGFSERNLWLMRHFMRNTKTSQICSSLLSLFLGDKIFLS